MTKPRFGKRLGFAAILAVAFAAPYAQAQSAQQAEPAPPKAGKLINAGDVLSGELNAMKIRGAKRGSKGETGLASANSITRLPPQQSRRPPAR